MKNALRLLCAATLTLTTLTASTPAFARMPARPSQAPIAATPGQTVAIGDNYGITSVARTGATVSVTVSMGGGCAEHTFEAHYRVDGRTVTFWLRHDAHHDTCEALISRTVQIVVPAGLPANAALVVRGASGTSYPVS